MGYPILENYNRHQNLIWIRKWRIIYQQKGRNQDPRIGKRNFKGKRKRAAKFFYVKLSQN